MTCRSVQLGAGQLRDEVRAACAGTIHLPRILGEEMQDMTRSAQTREERSPARRRWLRLRPMYLVIVVAMGLFTYAYLGKMHEIRGLSAQESVLQAQNRQIEQDNARTMRENKYYRTTGYEIQAARSKFGFDMPGETAIQVLPVTAPRVVVHRAPVLPAAPPPPVWRQWVQSFFG
jgi:cell division protein FtsB